MPITITAKEWAKKSAKPFWRNPFLAPTPIMMIYNRLINYHYACRVAPGSIHERDYMVHIQEFIDEYTDGMATTVVNGRKRYRDYRDRNGILSELERQVARSIAEFDRASSALSRASGPSMPPPNAPPPNAPPTQAAPTRAARGGTPSGVSLHSSNAMAVIRPRDSFNLGGAGSLNDLFGLNASVGGDQNSEAGPLMVINPAPVPAVQPAANARVDANAYDTAARFVQMSNGQRVTAQAIRDAVPRGLALSSGTVFHDLCRGLQEMNINVFHQQNVREVDLDNVLKNATNQRPVMLCVGAGGAAVNRVIICHGMHFAGNGQNIEAAFKVIDLRTGQDDAVLFGNGDFEATIGAETENLTWQPSLGYIKF